MKFVFLNVGSGKTSKVTRNYFFKTKLEPACVNVIYRKKHIANEHHYLYSAIKKEKNNLLNIRSITSIKQVVCKNPNRISKATIKNKSSIFSKTMDKPFSYNKQQYVDFVLFYLLNSYLSIREKTQKACESVHSVNFTFAKRTRPRTWFEMNAINEHRANVSKQNCLVQSVRKKYISFWRNLSNLKCTGLLCL